MSNASFAAIKIPEFPSELVVQVVAVNEKLSERKHRQAGSGFPQPSFFTVRLSGRVVGAAAGIAKIQLRCEANLDFVDSRREHFFM